MAGITEAQVVEVIKTIHDPEIPVNIFDLGLIYKVSAEGSRIRIRMTFTSATCPAAQAIPDDMRARLSDQLDVAPEDVEIEVVFDPPWNPAMITHEGREVLGIGA
jgi:metal-sulfur cluster biosynthetic enzyme